MSLPVISSVEQLPFGAPPPALQMKGHCVIVSAVNPQLDRTMRPVFGSMIAGVSVPEGIICVHVGADEDVAVKVADAEVDGVALAIVELTVTEPVKIDAAELKLAAIELVSVILDISKSDVLELAEAELASTELINAELEDDTLVPSVVTVDDARLVESIKAPPDVIEKTVDEETKSAKAVKTVPRVD